MLLNRQQHQMADSDDNVVFSSVALMPMLTHRKIIPSSYDSNNQWRHTLRRRSFAFLISSLNHGAPGLSRWRVGLGGGTAFGSIASTGRIRGHMAWMYLHHYTTRCHPPTSSTTSQQTEWHAASTDNSYSVMFWYEQEESVFNERNTTDCIQRPVYPFYVPTLWQWRAHITEKSYFCHSQNTKQKRIIW